MAVVQTLGGWLCVFVQSCVQTYRIFCKKIFKAFGVMATERKRVVLTVKKQVNIVSRLKENKLWEKLAE
jgi:hypothetical protein